MCGFMLFCGMAWGYLEILPTPEPQTAAWQQCWQSGEGTCGGLFRPSTAGTQGRRAECEGPPGRSICGLPEPAEQHKLSRLSRFTPCCAVFSGFRLHSVCNECVSCQVLVEQYNFVALIMDAVHLCTDVRFTM